MGKERTFGITEKPRTSGFVHVGEIIPGVLGDIEKRIKVKATSILEDVSKMEKGNNMKIHNASIPDLQVESNLSIDTLKESHKNKNHRR